MFEELECWSGMHILYAIVGICSALIFGAITLIVTCTYFENRQLSGNVLTKVNGRCELVDALNKVLACFFVTVFSSQNF